MPNPSLASVSGPFKIRHGMTVSARANSASSAKTVSATNDSTPDWFCHVRVVCIAMIHDMIDDLHWKNSRQNTGTDRK